MTHAIKNHNLTVPFLGLGLYFPYSSDWEHHTHYGTVSQVCTGFLAMFSFTKNLMVNFKCNFANNKQNINSEKLRGPGSRQRLST